MIYNSVCNDQLSLLGFGTMRLPQLADGSIDEPQVQRMVEYALSHGVNYFDTAAPYHGGNSEPVIGRALAAYPRESFFLATKYPGHQIADSYDPAEVFENQLKRCGVEYFDYYLLHNVYENSVKVYMDPQWGIVDYFKEQKRLGRIRHLGFSSHGSLDTIRQFLDYAGDAMEFCQIQLNYLDWTLQDGKAKYDLLTERGIPVWIMEPVRGGMLANLSDDAAAPLKAIRPDDSIASWGFRFLQDLPNVKMILSGMSNFDQMVDNVKTFEKPDLLNEAERSILFGIADGLKNSVPCTACRYCCDGCPQGLDIPFLLSIYNEVRVLPSFTVGMRVEALPEEKRPTACIGCGACAQICPQKIDIPAAMQDLADRLAKIPSWVELSRQRAAAAKAKKS